MKKNYHTGDRPKTPVPHLHLLSHLKTDLSGIEEPEFPEE